MDFVLFSWVAICIPLIIFFCFYMYKIWPLVTPEEDYDTRREYLADVAGTLANRVGFLGFWFLALFMMQVC